jgi:hypothetical protein
MALRGFQRGGVLWQVWSVIPGIREDGAWRRGGDRRSPDPVLLYRGPERRKPADRRTTAVTVSAAFAAGWLTGETLSNEDLARLCERATPVQGCSDG